MLPTEDGQFAFVDFFIIPKDEDEAST